ncbi:MAG: AgmX/PglI C-terminal domain-containing protein [Myxococcales bacterium]|nr:AgmX/PglI C-terminal domain-containing protein [Myxococcales bacterium]
MNDTSRAAQTLTASADRTRRFGVVLMVMAAPLELAGLIAMVFVAPAFAAPVFAMGLTLSFLAIFSLRDAARITRLLAEPNKVTHLVPIEVRAGFTHFPVMVVTDDVQLRVATGARSAGEAIAMLRPLFPAATIGGDDAYDRGTSTEKVRVLASLFGAMLLAATLAVVTSLPRVNRRKAGIDVAVKVAAEREATLKTAFAAVKTADVSGPWSACSFPLRPSVRVVLSGFEKGPLDATVREGSLIEGSGLLLNEPVEIGAAPTGLMPSLLVDALTGDLPEPLPPAARELAVVGGVAGNSLALRVVDLADGSVQCEGRTSFSAPPGSSGLERERVIAGAIMRPQCARLGPRTCAEVGPAEEDAPLDAEGIRAVVREASPQVRRCYERGLASQPKLAGTVTVSFSIEADGSAQKVTASKFGSSTVSSCLVEVVRALTFPARSGRAPVKVNYPFVLQPTK